MIIIHNGQELALKQERLDLILEDLGYGQGDRLATAVNESFVPASLRSEYLLKDGDRLEVVTPMAGG